MEALGGWTFQSTSFPHIQSHVPCFLRYALSVLEIPFSSIPRVYTLGYRVTPRWGFILVPHINARRYPAANNLPSTS